MCENGLGLVFVLKIHAQKHELIIWKLWLFDEKVGMLCYVSFQNISKILYKWRPANRS